MVLWGEPVTIAAAVCLLLALALSLSFEFVNGFHDTANAVATVIRTQASSRIPAWPCCFSPMRASFDRTFVLPPMFNARALRDFPFDGADWPAGETGRARIRLRGPLWRGEMGYSPVGGPARAVGASRACAWPAAEKLPNRWRRKRAAPAPFC
jgi:hypothetical protein